MSETGPVFSVIIATYNWSAALAIAIRSVLDQTLADFEVLVIGDACTDDSEQVVASFRDARLKWHNRAQNCGSQWGPNNDGLERARGWYVAYLGHDDLWFPTHLQSVRATLERTGADVVAAGALLYGPPGSGIRAVTGFFPNDEFSPLHFFPPSSMAHRPGIARRIGGWYDLEAARGNVDYDFLYRCHEAGASMATTGEFSVFKFNAAWRRNSYLHRDVSEQRRCLASIRRDGQAYLCRELAGALRASTEDRLVRIESPMKAEVGATEATKFNQGFKGSHRDRRAGAPIVVEGPVSFARDDDNEQFEWHTLERHPVLGAYRWSGPSTRAEMVLPVRRDRPFDVSLLVVGELREGLLNESTMSVNGSPVATTIEAADPGVHRWRAKAEPAQAGDDAPLRIALTVPRTSRPLDLGINADRRWLGLAIGCVELHPRPTAGGATPCC